MDLTALSVLGGGLAVGLGFGLQKIAANYVSGFVILAERSIRIGDMVKVDNFEGQITDIRTRYTVIRSLTGREAIIPNETLITTRVENSSLDDPRVLMQTTVPVAYGTDVRKLQPLLLAATAAVPRVVDKPAPSVQVATFTGKQHRAGRQLLDRRPGGRRRQRQVGGQPRGARRPARPGHRLSVRTADGAGDGQECRSDRRERSGDVAGPRDFRGLRPGFILRAVKPLACGGTAVWHTHGMNVVLPLVLVLLAAPAWAQIRAFPRSTSCATRRPARRRKRRRPRRR
jgi:hypothetical protein